MPIFGRIGTRRNIPAATIFMGQFQDLQWPPSAANEQMSLFHWQPLATTHCSTSTWPCNAAWAQVSTKLGHRLARARTKIETKIKTSGEWIIHVDGGRCKCRVDFAGVMEPLPPLNSSINTATAATRGEAADVPKNRKDVPSNCLKSVVAKPSGPVKRGGIRILGWSIYVGEWIHSTCPLLCK
jgi:hypothetical protein